jgi:hypothetical protein
MSVKEIVADWEAADKACPQALHWYVLERERPRALWRAIGQRRRARQPLSPEVCTPGPEEIVRLSLAANAARWLDLANAARKRAGDLCQIAR